MKIQSTTVQPITSAASAVGSSLVLSVSAVLQALELDAADAVLDVREGAFTMRLVLYGGRIAWSRSSHGSDVADSLAYAIGSGRGTWTLRRLRSSVGRMIDRERCASVSGTLLEASRILDEQARGA